MFVYVIEDHLFIDKFLYYSILQKTIAKKDVEIKQLRDKVDLKNKLVGQLKDINVTEQKKSKSELNLFLTNKLEKIETILVAMKVQKVRNKKVFPIG